MRKGLIRNDNCIYFCKYITGDIEMHQIRTKVFKSGNSQAVRLPREFRLDQEEVYIRKEGKSIVITPLPASWEGFMEDCGPLSDDYSIDGAPLPKDAERDAL